MATSVRRTDSSSGLRSLIPARIDRLPWSKFHTRMVMALGVAWILDGLEITIASNVGPNLTSGDTLNMPAGAVADIATWYLIGEVIGALFFGRLSDRLGRKNLFMITLAVYLAGSGLTAATPSGGYWFIFLYATRVLAGSGIGGEYAAINSAVDEMIPARYRGRVDLAVNGTYWAGAFLGTIITLIAINHIAPKTGWRVAYLVGPVLALVIIYVRRNLPESPRWQIMHGHEQEAEASIAEIEHDVAASKGAQPPVDPGKELEIRPAENIGYLSLLKVLFQRYPTRSVLGGALMITQSFLYNAILPVLDGGLLLRVGRRERGLPDGQRGVPAGSACQGDRGVLRDRAVLRLPGLAPVRPSDRHRARPEPALLELPARVGTMILGGLVAVFFAVDAEGKSLEEIARPLSVVAKPAEAIFRAGTRDKVIAPGIPPQAKLEHRSLARRKRH